MNWPTSVLNYWIDINYILLLTALLSLAYVHIAVEDVTCSPCDIHCSMDILQSVFSDSTFYTYMCSYYYYLFNAGIDSWEYVWKCINLDNPCPGHWVPAKTHHMLLQHMFWSRAFSPQCTLDALNHSCVEAAPPLPLYGWYMQGLVGTGSLV